MPEDNNRIVWDRKFETGYEVTDGRHESLILLFNDHIRYLKSSVSHLALKRNFEILISEMRLHFIEDCSFARDVNFSQLGSFTSDHSEKVDVIDRILRNPIDDHLIRRMTPLLRSWVHVHFDWGYELTREFDPEDAVTHLPPYPRVTAGWRPKMGGPVSLLRPNSVSQAVQTAEG